MLKDRNNIRKAFVEGGHIAIARFDKEMPQAVHQGMGHLMRGDVLRKACKHRLPWKVGPGVAALRTKITEEDRQEFRIIERVRSSECVGKQSQAPVAPKRDA